MEDDMTQDGFAHFAEALVFVHGNRALSEAARHAELAERSGDTESAARWRRTMSQLRGSSPTGTKQKQLFAA
jgi:hypothetical protein